ncbi:MAG TPA: Rrf2 family transcriptional regulator [Pseudolabrys sp.]|nr:Rrf2 family transcriptional regulator [Pseudolabrys sp.]
MSDPANWTHPESRLYRVELLQPGFEQQMSVVPRRGILAIAAVVDIAINANAGPVSAKTIAARHRLPPRHLEPVLQALVRDGILKGIRGPHGGLRAWARG